MTWEQFVELCRDWMRRLPPEQARSALKAVLKLWLADPTEARMEEAIALALAEPVPALEALGADSPHLNTANKPKKRKGNGGAQGAATSATSQPMGKRAQALVREQLKHGPRPGAQIEAAARAAAISERALIAAASALGVRTQRGQWWIPG